MGLGRLVNGRHQPISPFRGSWADTLHADPLPAAPVPPIMANQERVRQFRLRHPQLWLNSPEEVKAMWDRFVETYRDGVTRLPAG